MGKILVGLDRDDTISVNHDEDFGHQDNWRELLEFQPTVIEGLKLLYDHGCTLVVASNQSGIARGLFPEERQQEINAAIAELLDEHDIKIHSWNFCPFYGQSYALSQGYEKKGNPWILDDDDPRLDQRKPGIGMLKSGLRTLGSTLDDFTDIAFIGDQFTDVRTGLNAGGIGILIDIGEKNSDQTQLIDPNDPRQILVPNFYEAAETVLRTSYTGK